MSNVIPNAHKFPQELANVIWSALTGLQDEEYINGRTAAYWHVMSILDSHMVRNHNVESSQA